MPPPATPQLGIAVLGGAGGVGRTCHLPAIASNPRVRLVAVVDVDEKALAQVAADFGCQTYTDLERVLNRDDVHIIDICTPDHLHAPQAIAAAKAGKHVLCEKPLALSMDDALAVRQAVREAGVKLMVAQSMRFHPRWRSLRQLIASGDIGRPVFGRLLARGAFFRYPPDSFYRRPESLGLMLHNGMHYFDTLAWLMDSAAAWVWAAGVRHYPNPNDRLPGPNYWTVHVGFESGAIGHIEVNMAVSPHQGLRHEMGCFVVGDRGTAWSAPDAAAIVEQWNGRYTWPGAWPVPGGQEAFAAEIDEFAAAVAEARELPISLDWSIRILEACLACLRSAAAAERIRLTHAWRGDEGCSERIATPRSDWNSKTSAQPGRAGQPTARQHPRGTQRFRSAGVARAVTIGDADTIGVGVIGVGVRGQHAYETWLARRADCCIVAVAQQPDPSPAMLEGKDPTACAQEWAQRLGATFVDDWREVAQHPQIQLISVMCDPATAPVVVADVAAAGKHIIRDKYLASTLPQARACVEACEAAGVQMLVTYNVRYLPAVKTLIGGVQGGAIGRPLAATFVYLMGDGPLEGFTATQEYVRRVGGGELTTFGVYAIDVLLEVFGEMPESVFATAGAFFYPDYVRAGMEDMAQVTLLFSGGRVAHFVTGRTTTSPPPDCYFRLEVLGQRGTLTATAPEPVNRSSARKRAVPWRQASAVLEMLDDFLGALRAGRPSPIPARRGYEALAILKAAYVSAEQGRPVALAEVEGDGV